MISNLMYSTVRTVCNPRLQHCSVNILKSRKSAKYDYWCCLFAFPCLLVEFTCFHQSIGASGIVTSNKLLEQFQLHHFNGGKICSKILKKFSILNRQCAAMLASPIMGQDVKLKYTVRCVQF
jgi:hypothetical protein